MSNNIIKFEAKIESLSYKPCVGIKKLKEYEIEKFDINKANSFGIIKLNEHQKLGFSKWVSPKRTRSFPFSRVYNTYHLDKVVTIIPVLKDEGIGGDNDRINYITLSWLNLMNVYIILAWYDDAEYKSDTKITNQTLNNDYIKDKLKEIETYRLDAHHWNNNHFKKDFPTVFENAIKSYSRIEQKTEAKLHNPKFNHEFLNSILSDTEKNNLDLEKFKNNSLRKSEKAAIRESNTIHKLEVLSDSTHKGIFSITNNLGGKYALTCDEVIFQEDKIILQESKNSSTNTFPSENDIKDGLFKLILLSNIDKLLLNNEEKSFSTRLKLTGNFNGELRLPADNNAIQKFINQNNFSILKNKLINELNSESRENNISIIFVQNDKKKIYKKSNIRSPLRYPGGKSRALKNIIPIIPDFNEYREPLVGGGSVFFELKQLFPNKKFWINDIYEDLYYFWYWCQKDINKLVDAVKNIKKSYSNGRELYKNLTDDKNKFSDFEKAVRFFVLNRITFSGTVDSGGYSEQAFKRRFTDSSIERLQSIGPTLKDIRISNLDYSEVVNVPGDNVFIFLDPPYLSASKSKLYGKNGNLHTNFDHERFAYTMKNCKHKWLITYDNSEEVKKLFSFAYINEWELQYGMNNYKQGSAAKGKELFISNYPLTIN